ncbi:MAG: cupin domain-containing protein [Alphaproteobacteria bacterium]
MSYRFGRPLLAAAIMLAALPAMAQTAQTPQNYPAKTVLSTGQTILGEPIQYPAGMAKVTAAEVTIAPGGETLLHQHGVPMMVYILDGEVSVDYGDKGVRVFKTGDAFVEAMSTHKGMNKTAKPVRILAIYMGSDSGTNVVPQGK